jgi:hypothetical protein
MQATEAPIGRRGVKAAITVLAIGGTAAPSPAVPRRPGKPFEQLKGSNIAALEALAAGG